MYYLYFVVNQKKLYLILSPSYDFIQYGETILSSEEYIY